MPSGARIALAFSGGRDSVVLFDLLAAAGADFFAVHVEHGIRGENSVKDAEFAERFCRGRGVDVKVYHVDRAQDRTRERDDRRTGGARGALRSVRQAACGRECDLVALAHHADDQTETVLMRIFRGTGIRGLRGMSYTYIYCGISGRCCRCRGRR